MRRIRYYAYIHKGLKMTRKCSACHRIRPEDEFPVSKRKRSGVVHRRSRCRKCFNESRRVNRVRSGLRSDSDAGTSLFRENIPKAVRYVITYAQNATPVNSRFLSSLLVMCREKNAELIIIPGRYKNPTSVWNDGDDDWWDSSIAEYCYDGQLDLDGVTVYGDISIVPTAVRPLSGMEILSKTQDGIFGHPKVQLATVPTGRRRYPRMLTTTGAVTQANYTNSKAGKKANPHHVFGATIIEKGKKHWHMRQINAKGDGSFIDLDRRYTSSGSEPASEPLALICGDVHVEKLDETAVSATLTGNKSIAGLLRPRHIIYHDLFDGDARNHHEAGRFISKYKRHHGLRNDSVFEEVKSAIKFIDNRTPSFSRPVIVKSNHDEFLDRWLNTADFRADPENARFFIDSWSRILGSIDESGYSKPAFQMWYEELGSDRAKFLDREEEFILGECDLQFHGDKGLNGSRGSILAYSKLAVRTVIGHGHCAGILDGCYQVGVLGMLNMGYNVQPSGWTHTNCLLYANGKRTLVHIKDGEWRRND